jgi:hypothetical protein
MATMPKQRQGNDHNDASAAMKPAPQQQRWQRCQGNVCNDVSAATATMPKQRQGNVRDDVSATICQRRNDASATTAALAMMPGQPPQ